MRSQPASNFSPLRLLVTGGTGVLGRALRPLAEAAGHELAMPGREELDLFDPSAVADAVRDVDGVLHLATRIRSLEQISDPEAWRENDRLRADASRILVDAAIAAGAAVYVQPTVTFVYPPDGPVSEDTPVGEVLPILRSALAAEQQTERFARAGGRGVVLRFGLLDGPGTWFDQPMGDFGATLHVSDAGRALLSALSLPSGIYNVCRDGERVSNERFTRAAGWHPQRRSDHAPHRQQSSRAAATCCGRCTAPATPSCFRTPGTWPRREPWSRLDFPWSRPPAAAWPPRSATRTTRVRRPTRCSPRPRGSQGASRCR